MTHSVHEQDMASAASRLNRIYVDLRLLQEFQSKLLNIGLRQDDLPLQSELQAFVLLGDHDKDELLKAAQPVLSQLAGKGLLMPHAGIVCTPALRLFIHIEPLLDVVESLWERLGTKAEIEPATADNLHCRPDQVIGLWGQQKWVDFAARDVTHVLVQPDTVFTINPALLIADSDNRCAGRFQIPVDMGGVTLTLALSNGELRRHRIAVQIGQP